MRGAHMNPSDHFKIGPECISQLLFELQGRMCCPGTTMSPLDEGILWYISGGSLRTV